MSSPGDYAREVSVPIYEEPSATGPDDNETTALDSGRGDTHSLDPGERDTEILSTAAEIHGDRPEVVGEDGADIGDSGRSHVAGRLGTQLFAGDTVEIPKQYGGQDWVDQSIFEDETAVGVWQPRVRYASPFEAEVEEAGIEDRDDVKDRDGDAEAVQEEVYEYDEEQDFDPQASDLAKVPSDLLRLYVNDMRAEVHTKEQVIERAKDVEAGLAADWVLRINDAVDNPGPDSLLNLRDDYIEARRENMRLESESEADDEAESSEVDDPAEESGTTLTKTQQTEQRTARNKEIKHEKAIEEIDDMIALALCQRVDVEPGRTELSGSLRADLEDMVGQGTNARNEMIRSIERWTFQESMKFGYQGGLVHLSRSDLSQEGSLGAIRAVMKFDYTRGFSLTTYSNDWTKKFVGQAIEHGHPVRLPTGMPANLAKVHKAEEGLLAKLQPGDELTEEAVAAVLKWSSEKLAEVRKYDQMTVSLDKPIGADTGVTLADMRRDSSSVDPYQVVAKREQRAKLPGVIDEVLTAVSIDERGNKDSRIEQILRYRFALNGWQNGQPMSQEKIAQKLGISQMHVGRLEKRGLARIRQNPELMELLQAYRG